MSKVSSLLVVGDTRLERIAVRSCCFSLFVNPVNLVRLWVVRVLRVFVRLLVVPGNRRVYAVVLAVRVRLLAVPGNRRVYAVVLAVRVRLLVVPGNRRVYTVVL